MKFKNIFFTLAVTFLFFSTTAWSMIEDSDNKEGIICRVKTKTQAQFVSLEEQQTINNKTNKTSLTELYLVSSVKKTAQMINEVITFAVRNPALTTVIILNSSMFHAVVAYCQCQCSSGYVGTANSPSDCAANCKAAGKGYVGCDTEL